MTLWPNVKRARTRFDKVQKPHGIQDRKQFLLLIKQEPKIDGWHLSVMCVHVHVCVKQSVHVQVLEIELKAACVLHKTRMS